MDGAGLVFAAGEWVMREAALFAAAGFLLLGLGDLAVDLVWIVLRIRGRGGVEAAGAGVTAAPGRLVLFVPAWDEAAVIGRMLRATLAAWGPGDYRLYVGCYPNDPATIAAVREVADPHLRLVVGPVPGPTTKADCLNRLWEALLAEEGAQGWRAKGIVLHDAEDLAHSAEPRIFGRLIDRFDLVQLPVLPLIDPRSRWIGGHYADEFAEAHGKELLVRQALGASLPSAGVGCAVSRKMLARIAAGAGGLPFAADSLAEDYELGLRIGELGGRAAFVRERAGPSGRLVATRAYFPGTARAAIAQKSRWIAGIALSGWDRLGWRGGAAERWMRLRDRQSPLAALILLAGYGALGLWLLLAAKAGLAGTRLAPLPPALLVLTGINLALLAWRAALRLGFVAAAHGWREGLLSVPRMIVANLILMLAALAALGRYRAARGTGALRWDKTLHAFPAELPAE